ncbi:MAG TPA: hypothetical protein VF204_07180 [Streptosporangiaceae bacterium]
MYPLLTEYLANEHVRDMHASATASRRVRRARRGRHQSTVVPTVLPVTAKPFVPAPREPVGAGSSAGHR